MNRDHFPFARLVAACVGAALLLGLTALPGRAAASLTQQISPVDVNVGDEVTVSISVLNGGAANVTLPPVDGLQLEGTSTSTNITFTNGALTSAVSQNFVLVPQRAGDFTIPAFDVHANDGQVLHAHEMKLHASGNGASGAPAGNPAPGSANGPVVFPSAPSDPNAPAPDNNAADLSGDNLRAPLGSDGRPARVFMVITPRTTDAYVGETIPLRIEFFIQMDALAQQDSLPTMKSNDFLMNDLSLRPQEDELTVSDVPYHRETWVTAISAPKVGDFPLQMVRDTYWMKNPQGIFSDPLGNFFGPNPGLTHANIPSNQLVIHVHPLPDEGQPPDFTGAIGQFRVAGNASPVTVNVGEPVYLDFDVSGEGNFDRVRCPSFAADPDWKSYTPSSKVTYSDESRTQGEKMFHQALIPQKGGALSLPQANFSYFDPAAKKYVTVPISLPSVTVTGAAPAPAAAPATAGDATAATGTAPAEAAALLPNRLEFGSLHSDLTPAFRQPWFWAVQAAALLAVVLAAPLLWLHSRRKRDETKAERASRRQSLRELEAAMTEAVQRDDAPAFFLAARRAVQVRWGAPFGLPPEAVTLPLIAEKDPALAERLTPLFSQADEVIYSGHAATGLDLADWERQVQAELQQFAPV
jgi:hypothetical protein